MAVQRHPRTIFEVALLEQDGDFAIATSLVENVLDFHPSNLQAINTLTQMYLQEGWLSHSLNACADSLAVDQRNPVGLYTMAAILLSLGNPEGAFDKCRILAETEDNSHTFWNHLGATYYSLDKIIAVSVNLACSSRRFTGIGYMLSAKGALHRSLKCTIPLQFGIGVSQGPAIRICGLSFRIRGTHGCKGNSTRGILEGSELSIHGGIR